jgi:hypothetical protein
MCENKFINKPVEQIAVSDQILRSCLELAIKRFNSNDRANLLRPRRYPTGQYAKKNEKGWGGASERSISHRLAFYLECELRKIGIVRDGGLVVVDCEYNRHLDGMKHIRIPEKLKEIVEKAKRNPKPISDDEDFYVVSVAPDIVVHQRGEDALNLLVIEVKKTSNTEVPEYDDLKLSCFTKQTEKDKDEFGYQLGFAVVALDNIVADKRELRLSTPYANGEPQAADYATNPSTVSR